MADRYWVGGTGTWSTNTTNWSATSGGISGASAPTSADNVIFDQNSNSGTNAFTVTLGGLSRLSCASLTIQNLDGVMTLAGSMALDIYGSLTFPSSNLTLTTTSSFSFLSTTAQTITTGGLVMPNSIFNGGSTGSWVLQDNFTTTNSVNLDGGTLDLNGKTLTTTTISTSGTNTKYFKSATNTSMVLTGSSGLFFVGLSGSNLTVDNTITFNIASTYLTTTGSINNTTTAPINVTFTNTGINYIASLGNGSLFRRLDFTNYWNTTLSMGTNAVTVTESLIIPSTLTISGTSGTNHFVFAPPSTTTATFTNSGGTANYGISINGTGGTLRLTNSFSQGSAQLLTLTAGTLDINSQTVSAGVFTIATGTHAIANGNITAASVNHTSGDLSIGTGYNVTCTGAYTFTAGSITINDGVNLSVGSMSSSNTNTRSIAFGTGSITTTGTGTVWNVTGATGFSFTGTGNITISNNTATAVTVNNTATSVSAMNFNFINGTYTLTLTNGCSFNNLDFTGFRGIYAESTSVTNVYGNLVLSSLMSMTTVGGSIDMRGTSGVKTITTNGKTITSNIRFNGLATFKLMDNFNASAIVTFIAGNIDFNNVTYNLSGSVNFSGTFTYTNVGGAFTAANVSHNSGTITLGLGSAMTISGQYTFAGGTITINDGVSLRVGSFVSNYTTTRVINFGTGSITTTGTGTTWNVTSVTGLTYTGTPTVNIDNNTATAVTVTNTATSASAMNFNFINGTYALTLSSGNTYRNLNFTGFSGTVAFATTTHTMYGNLTLGSGTTTSATAGTATFTWNSTSGTRTITSNGATSNFGIALNGVGQTLQLADAFIQGSTQLFSYVSGTLNLAGYSNLFGNFTITSGTHSITNGTLNSASVTHTSGDLSVSIASTVNCVGTYTFTSGTINIGDGSTLSVGQFSSSNSNVRSIAFNVSGILAITSSGTAWNTGTVTNFSYTGNNTIRLTYNGSAAVTINAGPMTAAQALNFYITAGTYSLTITSLSNVNTLDFTGFSGTYAGGTSIVFILTNLVFSGTMTGTNSGGGSLRMAANSGIATITTNGATIGNNIYFGGTGTFRLADNFTQTSSASFTIDTGNIDINSKTANIGILTIVSGTHSIMNGTINCVSVTHTSGDLSIGTGYNVTCNGAYTFTAGSITINNGVNLLVGSMSSPNTNTRSIAFGTGSITATGSGTVWNVTGVTGLTYTGTPTINISNNTATAATVTNTATATNAFDFNFINGTYTLTLTSGNAYRNLNFTGFSGTVALTTTTHTMYGNLTLGSGTTTSATAGNATFTWNSTSGTRTITSNGRTANFGIALNGVGQTLQLADAFIQGTTQLFSFVNGTLDLAGYSNSFGNFTVTTGTHSIANGTLTCATVTHTSGDLSTGAGYTLVCNGTYTWTAGTITINDNATLTTFAFSSNNSNVRSLSFGSSGSITITGKSATVWFINLAGITYTGSGIVKLTATGTGTNTTINSTTGTINNSFAFEIQSGSYPITTTFGASFKKLDFTGYTGTWNNTTGINVFGDLVLSSGMTIGTAGSITFGTGTYDATITCNTRSLNGALTLNNTGNITFGDNFSSSSSITRSTSGTLTANGDVQASSVTLNGSAYLGSGVWRITGSGTSWTTGASATITPGTSTIQMNATSPKTFAGAGKTYYNLVQGNVGTMTISGSNTFNDIYSLVAPTTITVTAGTTQTLSNFTLSGISPNKITLNSSTPGSSYTLLDSSGTVSVSYLTISDSNATGGATWNAFTSNGNTNGGNNTGWVFTSPNSNTGGFFLFF